jgi:hypothetical protein
MTIGRNIGQRLAFGLVEVKDKIAIPYSRRLEITVVCTGADEALGNTMTAIPSVMWLGDLDALLL